MDFILGSRRIRLPVERCSKDEMVVAIRKVAMGETYFSHSMSSYVKSAKVNQKEELVASLTARESEVLELIAEGLRNREMAQRLQITTRTVEYHVANIMGKLGAKSRLEAVVIYMNNATGKRQYSLIRKCIVNISAFQYISGVFFFCKQGITFE